MKPTLVTSEYVHAAPRTVWQTPDGIPGLRQGRTVSQLWCRLRRLAMRLRRRLARPARPLRLFDW